MRSGEPLGKDGLTDDGMWGDEADEVRGVGEEDRSRGVVGFATRRRKEGIMGKVKNGRDDADLPSLFEKVETEREDQPRALKEMYRKVGNCPPEPCAFPQCNYDCIKQFPSSPSNDSLPPQPTSPSPSRTRKHEKKMTLLRERSRRLRRSLFARRCMGRV